MEKTKKAIKELASYLGNDRRGLDLLEKVSRATNEKRKEAANSLERVQELDGKTEHLRCELSREFGLRKRLESEKQRLQSQLTSMQLELSRYRNQVSQDPQGLQKTKSPDPFGFDAFKRLFKALQKDFAKCPTLVSDGRPIHYQLSDIVEGYSGAEAMKLGALIMVAGTMMRDGRIVIECDVNPMRRVGENIDAERFGVIVRWMRDLLDDRGTLDRAMSLIGDSYVK